jgi:hypothetical protein
MWNSAQVIIAIQLIEGNAEEWPLILLPLQHARMNIELQALVH